MSDNIPIPAYLHIPTTILTLSVFLISIQQLCSASMNRSAIKYRAGVVCSCFTLLILSICLNFDIERNNGNLPSLDGSFVYIVRTLMVLYNFVVIILAYFIIQYAVRAAYKSSHGINRQEPPPWVSKFWFVVICSEEIMMFLCYVFAFALDNILPLKILFVSTYFVGILGCIIILCALLDVHLAISRAVHNIKEINKIKNGQKIVRTIMILSLLVVIGCLFNFIALLINIFNSTANKSGTLRSTAMDTPSDYILYMYILISVDIAFIFWTYRPESINYCFYCCMYKRYTKPKHIKTKIDKTVLCYLCCAGMIDKAESNRENLIKKIKEKQMSETEIVVYDKITHNNNNNNQNNNTTDKSPPSGKNVTVPLSSPHNTEYDHHQMDESIAQQNSENGPPTDLTERKNTNTRSSPLKYIMHRQASNAETRIRVVIYQFEGVITNEPYRQFGNYTIDKINQMSKENLEMNFNGSKRVRTMNDHFKVLYNNGVKLYIISQEETKKLSAILQHLDFKQYFMASKQSRLDVTSIDVTSDTDTNDTNDINNGGLSADEDGKSKFSVSTNTNTPEHTKDTFPNNTIIRSVNVNINGSDDESNDLTNEQPHYFDRSAKDNECFRALMYGIIGSDNYVMKQCNGDTKGFILELIRLRSSDVNLIYDEILYVSHDINLVSHFKDINLCRAMQIERIGIDSNDFADIEVRCKVE